jgi:2-polyprenyl-6-methoxyphenol hydroxylase-like FAD-dependent oxidoreductase
LRKDYFDGVAPADCARARSTASSSGRSWAGCWARPRLPRSAAEWRRCRSIAGFATSPRLTRYSWLYSTNEKTARLSGRSHSVGVQIYDEQLKDCPWLS